MLIEIEPSEVIIKPERFEAGLSVFALWQDNVRAGLASCIWDNDEKTRLLLADLEVNESVLIKPKSCFRREQRANFRGLGIGKQLLREVIRQAPFMGGRELFGKVVESDLEQRPFLLDWYAREGFEICEPTVGDVIPHKKKIVMRFE